MYWARSKALGSAQFFWLTLPTLLLCLLGEAVPLAAGLAAASFSINSGLLILLLALG